MYKKQGSKRERITDVVRWRQGLIYSISSKDVSRGPLHLFFMLGFPECSP